MVYQIITPRYPLQKWVKRYWLLQAVCYGFFFIIKSSCQFLTYGYIFLSRRSKWLTVLNVGIQRAIKKCHSTIGFFKVAALNPREVGAVLPSSKYLAKAMLDQVSLGSNELIVELGAGTGVITQAILEKKISPKQVIAIEYVPELAKKLRQTFPDIQVIHGSAAELESLLQQQTRPIGAIVSGLPLRSLPKVTKNRMAL